MHKGNCTEFIKIQKPSTLFFFTDSSIIVSQYAWMESKGKIIITYTIMFSVQRYGVQS